MLLEYNDPYRFFCEYDYSSKWYEKISFEFVNKNHKIWENWNEKKTITIWGSGQFGTKIIWAAYLLKKRIDYVVDSKIDKVNTNILGHKISAVNLGKLCDEDLIVVTIYDDDVIRQQLKEVNIEIIYLKDYLH